MSISRFGKLFRVALCPPCWRGIPKGVLASMEHEALLRKLASLECRTIVDIGANRGQFALAAHTLVPRAKIFSFEPLAEPSRTFRSLFAEDKRVRLQQLAIGPSAFTATMHVSGRDDSSSLLPIGELQTQLFPGTGEIGLVETRVAKLDEVLSPADIVTPALLKLDVQGYELYALGGCMDLLSLFSHGYVECSFAEFYKGQALAKDITAFFSDHHFSLSGIYNLVYDSSGHPLQGDFLFINQASAVNTPILATEEARA